VPAFADLHPQRLPSRSRLADDLVPLATDLVLGRLLAPPDPVELVADLAAGRYQADEKMIVKICVPGLVGCRSPYPTVVSVTMGK
jgi:hypothetical protein